MKTALALTLASFHGWWTFTVPTQHLRWTAYVHHGSHHPGRLRHKDGSVALSSDIDGVQMRIMDETGCHQFFLPKTFTKPHHRIDGTVSPCFDPTADSASAAFVSAAFIGRRAR